MKVHAINYQLFILNFMKGAYYAHSEIPCLLEGQA